MIIALFPNSQKKESYHLAVSIQEFLIARGVTVVFPDEEAKKMQGASLSQINPKEIDFLLSMGGDGSILQLVHSYPEIEAAIIGVNLGHLGFMADIPLADLYPSLQDLLSGAYQIEERMAIDGELPSGQRFFAVNDIVIHRGRNSTLVELAIHVDDLYVNTFEADGIILSTPNGSTAYSLAAGGPILSPSLRAFLLTPISPHTISNRPMVLTSNHVIQIQYLSPYDPLDVSSDGITRHELHTGDILKISQSQKVFRLVTLLRRDYFSTLRTKLSWSGKLR